MTTAHYKEEIEDTKTKRQTDLHALNEKKVAFFSSQIGLVMYQLVIFFYIR